MLVGSENVCVSSGQTPPTFRAARQGGTLRASGESTKGPGRAINLWQGPLAPQEPRLFPPPLPLGGSALWGGGGSVILHHPLPIAVSPGTSFIRPAGFMSPHGAWALCHSTLWRIISRNH